MLDSIKKIIPESFKLYCRRFLYNFKRIKKGKKRLITEYEYITIGDSNLHSFFGYYDISPFGPNDNFIYHEVKHNETSVNIVVENLLSRKKEVIATSLAWNWQQGSRLRWMPGKKQSIIFNDFRDNRHCSREINLETKIEIKHKYPFYDISPDGLLGITLDFTRLGYKRPGYGYRNLPFEDNDQILNKGVDIIDVNTDEIIKTITYEDIAKTMELDYSNMSNWYLNHLSFSPTGRRFIFFFIQDIKGEFFASLLCYDINNETLKVLEKRLKVSHYDWYDDDIVMCTACNSNRCWYNIYSIDDDVVSTFCADLLKIDGHPSYINKNLIITDTYPDANMFQHIYLANNETNDVKLLASVFHVLSENVEKRTDLHPRLSEDTLSISFDCNKSGKREIVIIHKKEKYGE